MAVVEERAGFIQTRAAKFADVRASPVPIYGIY